MGKVMSTTQLESLLIAFFKGAQEVNKDFTVSNLETSEFEGLKCGLKEVYMLAKSEAEKPKSQHSVGSAIDTPLLSEALDEFLGSQEQAKCDKLNKAVLDFKLKASELNDIMSDNRIEGFSMFVSCSFSDKSKFDGLKGWSISAGEEDILSDSIFQSLTAPDCGGLLGLLTKDVTRHFMNEVFKES